MSDLLAPPTHDDVYDDMVAVAGKRRAEVVEGEVVVMSPTGDFPARAAENILLSLREHERRAGGRAGGDGRNFMVDLPGRRSLCPDASYVRTPDPTRTMRFVVGAPDFAAEVRSEGDYGPRMEAKLARKRADYFAAGTRVVWDVDLLGDDTVRAYRAEAPESPAVFRRGDTADAEPAVPGWRFPVDELFA